MISFKDFRVLEERVEKIKVDTFMTGSDWDKPTQKTVKVIINPKEVELVSFWKRSKFQELRGLINGKNLVIWDADDTIHENILDALKFDMGIKGRFEHIFIKVYPDDKVIFFSTSGFIAPRTIDKYIKKLGFLQKYKAEIS